MKKRLRRISLGMFVVAAIFVFVALSNTGAGSIWRIGNVIITAHIMRIFYSVYVVIMALLFVASFCVRE